MSSPCNFRFFGFVLPFLLAFPACSSATVYRSSPDGGTEDVPTPRGVDGGDGGDGGSTSTTKDGITIGITTVLAALEIGGTKAASGGELIVVEIRVSNEDAPSPVHVAYPLFTLATTDSLVKTPELAASAALEATCPQTTTIDKGGSIECAIVFDVKQNTAKELRYKTPTGATLAVPAPPVKRCHDAKHFGTPAPIMMGDPRPQTWDVALPIGTYALARGVRQGSAGMLLPTTIRVGSTVFDHTVTLDDGVVVQTSATYTTDHANEVTAHLTYTCVSPYFDLPATEDIRMGYLPSSQTLLWFVDPEGSAPAMTLHFAKK